MFIKTPVMLDFIFVYLVLKFKSKFKYYCDTQKIYKFKDI